MAAVDVGEIKPPPGNPEFGEHLAGIPHDLFDAISQIREVGIEPRGVNALTVAQRQLPPV